MPGWLRSVVLPVSLVLGAVPVRAPAQTTHELHLEALGQARAGGNIPWSPGQPLSWKDFRGRPQQGLFKASETFSSVTYLIGCLRQETRFTVLATFSTTESWVRQDVRGDSVATVYLLQHEQTHFDLSEVLARQLRHALRSATDLCPANLGRARELFDSLSASSRALQAQYDQATAHGTDRDAQRLWTRSVLARLDSLAAFAD